MQISRQLGVSREERRLRGADGKIELSSDTLQQLMAEEAEIIAMRRSVQKAARNARRSS